MLGVSIRDKIRNVEIHSSKSREAEAAIGRAHSSEKGWTWGPKVLEWQPQNGKRSVGRPPTRWTDDIKCVAGSRWIQAAQNRGIWNSLQKTYVQPWTSIG
ncbi:jg17257 [Pararge aegeria aegeria]|uniref:Jg17257 protein n=1 Tax=Pararge aegeria aegeria TaxID=348720 RepID=A0A8S4SD98_9NEOP|nr:jg17257 [Pararge aegeria aegeria]